MGLFAGACMHVLVALLKQQQDEEEDEEGFVLPLGSFLALGRNLRRKDSLMGAEVSDEVGGRATTSQPASPSAATTISCRAGRG